jgi:hypothetical protein
LNSVSDGVFIAQGSVMTSCSRSSSSDASDYTFGDADVRISDVKTMLVDVFQTLVGIHPGPCLSVSAQFDRFKERPRRKLRG